jgi:hypothetical protein
VASVVALYHRFGVRLPDTSLNDGWVTCRCFTGQHADRHPSARVHLRSGGFRCFTCNQGGGVLDALQILGVWDRDEARKLAVEYGVLDPPPPPRRPRPGGSVGAIPKTPTDLPLPEPASVETPEPAPAEPEPKPALELGAQVDWDHVDTVTTVRDRHWIYHDQQGIAVGRVRRLDLSDGNKRVWQERPTGDEQWLPGLEGKHLPLYRLPQVLEHAQAGRRVVVVEGEKCVDALDRLGVFATTNPAGAGKWWPDHTHALAGATVLLVGDCDEPGRLHALHVTQTLHHAGVRALTPLDLSELRHDGYDLVDYLTELADTFRATFPETSTETMRERLANHLEKLFGRQLPADPDQLLERLEQVRFQANPTGKAWLTCERCRRNRVHKVTHGLAYCPCGHHQAAPA